MFSFRKSGVKGVIKCKNGNTSKIGVNQYKNDSCYILQDDHLFTYFTVYEIMYSTTQLKTDLYFDKINYLVSALYSFISLTIIDTMYNASKA